MAANTSPIYSKQGLIGSNFAGAPITAANTAKDGASGTVTIVFTADVTNGSKVDRAVVQPIGTNVATVMRFFLNNGSATTTAANNIYLKDVSLLATTNSETTSIGNTEVPLDLVLPPGWRIFVTIGTAVAAGFHVAILGGIY